MRTVARMEMGDKKSGRKKECPFGFLQAARASDSRSTSLSLRRRPWRDLEKDLGREEERREEDDDDEFLRRNEAI